MGAPSPSTPLVSWRYPLLVLIIIKYIKVTNQYVPFTHIYSTNTNRHTDTQPYLTVAPDTLHNLTKFQHWGTTQLKATVILSNISDYPLPDLKCISDN